MKHEHTFKAKKKFVLNDKTIDVEKSKKSEKVSS